MSQIPIPAATPDQQRWCERLSEALIWLHRPGAGEKAAGAPVSLMTAWFEQWLNGLVYELFFAEELHARHLHLFAATAQPENAPPDLTKLPEAEKLPRLQQLFERTYAVNHPLRAMLFDLRSLETIRLIEGTSENTNAVPAEE